VFDNYDPVDFLSKISRLRVDKNSWVGTHCWPGLLDVDQFDRVIIITTTTCRSKLYRWIRAYHHYYLKSLPWLEVFDMDRIDKERETAKNYLKPFLPVDGPNVINIEFAEIVDKSQQFINLTAGHKISASLTRWRKINNFLYDDKIWHSTAVKRYYEAELEVNLNQYYVYT